MAIPITAAQMARPGFPAILGAQDRPQLNPGQEYLRVSGRDGQSAHIGCDPRRVSRGKPPPAAGGAQHRQFLPGISAIYCSVQGNGFSASIHDIRVVRINCQGFHRDALQSRLLPRCPRVIRTKNTVVLGAKVNTASTLRICSNAVDFHTRK